MRSLLDERAPAPLITPRDYQLEDTEAILAAYRRGVRRGLAVLPTGVGKTVTGAHVAEQHLAEFGGRTVFLAHRDDLIRQTREKFLAVWPGCDLGVVKAEEDDARADVVVASVQTVSNRRRLARILDGPPIGLVIADEAHHIASASWESVIAGLGCMADDGPHLLGLTATPARSDRKGLKVFEEVVVERDIRWAIAHRHLVDVRAKRVQLALDLDTVKKTHGDYQDSDLARAMRDADAPELIVKAYLEHAADRRAVCFTPTLDFAEQVSDAFQAAGVPAAWVAGRLGPEERQRIYRQLRTGEIRVIASCALLTEGWDEPSVDAVICARPTYSAGLHIQMLGRGLRTFPGKQDCMILDVVGVTKRLGMRVAADLLGASEKAQEESERLGIPLGEAVRREEDLAPTGGRLVSEDVDLWAEFDRAPVAWSQTPNGSFVVTLPSLHGEQSFIRLREEAGEWVITFVTREDRKGPYWSKLLGAFEDMTLAQSFAEAQAMRMSGTVRKDAGGGGVPASPRQIARLSASGVRIPDGLTKRQASSLIDGLATRVR